jgi:16S rRNA G527 N7-methylase RsmG
MNFEIVYLKNRNISKYLKNSYSDSQLKSSEFLNALMIKNLSDDVKIINSDFEEMTFKDTDIITLN